jgi:signal transduction histidine kinase
MVLQVGALRTTLDPADRAAGVLAGVERLGREAVDELRGLVGLLREEQGTAPSPSLARVPDLLAEVRSAGLPVTLETAGEPQDLPQAVDVAAYRVLQEALSNVLRHAGRVPTTVRIRHETGALAVCVEDDGGPAPAVAPTGPGGHGLLGVRERVGVLGGTVDAGPRPEGGFRLQARFPVRRLT